MASNPGRFGLIGDDVISRSIKQKKYTRNVYNSNTYQPGDTMQLSVPSLPSYWIGTASYHNWKIAINATTTQAAQAVYLSQYAPHCMIQRAQVISSNSESLCNIQNYWTIHRALALLHDVSENNNIVLQQNVNQSVVPSSTIIQNRTQPFVVAQPANASTATYNITVQTSFGMLPLFGLTSLIDLGALSTQTRNALTLEFQLNLASAFSGVAGGGTINSVVITPVYYMAIVDPSDELRSAVNALIDSGKFLVPIRSYLSVNNAVPAGSLNTTIRLFSDEEDIRGVIAVAVPTIPFGMAINGSAWDTPNNFSNAAINFFQIFSGGVYFPAYSGLIRSYDPTDARDAAIFFRNVLNLKLDNSEENGTMINAEWYHPAGNGTEVATPDFMIAYSFDNNTSSNFSGYNCRANSGVMDLNFTYSPTYGGAFNNNYSGTLYAFSAYGRIYNLNPGGMMYVTKAQYIDRVNQMTIGEVQLLNQLLFLPL